MDVKPDLHFIMEAGHHLRTSLTILRGYMSLAKTGDTVISQQTAEKLSVEIDALNHEINNIITLLRKTEMTYRVFGQMRKLLEIMARERDVLHQQDQQVLIMLKEIDRLRLEIMQGRDGG